MSFIRLPTTRSRGDHVLINTDSIAYVSNAPFREVGSIVYVAVQTLGNVSQVRLATVPTTLGILDVEQMIRKAVL